MDYIHKQRVDIQQLEIEIEVLSAKIPDAIFKGTPQDLQSLFFKIDSLKSRLIEMQSHLIDCYHSRLQSESSRLERMYEVTK